MVVSGTTGQDVAGFVQGDVDFDDEFAVGGLLLGDGRNWSQTLNIRELDRTDRQRVDRTVATWEEAFR